MLKKQFTILRILPPAPHPQYLSSCIQHFLHTRVMPFFGETRAQSWSRHFMVLLYVTLTMARLPDFSLEHPFHCWVRSKINRMGEDIPCTLQLLQLLTKNPEGSTSKETVAPALCQKDGCTENEFK